MALESPPVQSSLVGPNGQNNIIWVTWFRKLYENVGGELSANLTGLTASVAELNKLDGVTASTAELNILDGLTASTADLNATTNFEETISATTAQVSILTGKTLNIVDNGAFKLNGTAVTSTAAELNKLDGVTASTAELNILSGITASTGDLNSTLNFEETLSATTSEVTVTTGKTINMDDGALKLNGTAITATATEINTLDGITASTAELNLIDGSTAGTTVASKALVAGSNKDLDELDITTLKNDQVTLSPLKYVEATILASELDSGGSSTILTVASGDQYKVREIILSGDGTNYDASGDRDIVIQDSSGTIQWTIIPNATIESISAARWGDTGVPYPATATDLLSGGTAGENIVAKYSGGTTDHSGTGSIKVLICLEKVA